MTINRKIPWAVAVFIGALYGIVCQLATRSHLTGMKDLYGAMSFGYVFILPFAMGALTVWAAGPEQRRNIWYCLFMPWLTTLVSLVFALIIGWEGAICFVMGAVIFLPLSSIGGLIAYFIVNSKRNRTLTPAALAIILASPPLSAIIEARYDLPMQMYTAATSIEIDAPVDRVWQNIIRVPPITEPVTGTFYKMGFPRPIEATLSHEGIGGVRHAIFDKNLVFIETVTEWVDQRKLSFGIKADSGSTPLTTLDEHVTVGGRYFDVLQGTYEIETPPIGKPILHLYSHFRVSTRFNFYAGLWARFLMKDIQESILVVIKQRCESGFVPLQQNSSSFL